MGDVLSRGIRSDLEGTNVNVVLTSLLTRESDPMRGYKWPPDASILETWADSIKGAVVVVIADELQSVPFSVTHLESTNDLVDSLLFDPIGGPYFNRWLYAHRWLEKHADSLRWVWITDGSDVVMLREPWDRMEHGVLYLGSENQVVGCDWMQNTNHHPSLVEQEFVRGYVDLSLYNAGLVGGDVETVMEFLETLISEWALAKSPSKSDMALFNRTAWLRWAGPLVTGEFVHTTFGDNVDNGTAWWKHK